MHPTVNVNNRQMVIFGGKNVVCTVMASIDVSPTAILGWQQLQFFVKNFLIFFTLFI